MNIDSLKHAAEQLNPPMSFNPEIGTFSFDDERFAEYGIDLRDEPEGFGNFVTWYPSGMGWRETLEEAHASLCSDMYYAGLLTDEKWMERCDACGKDWVADAGRMLPNDVWLMIANKPEELLCDTCIAKRLDAVTLSPDQHHATIKLGEQEKAWRRDHAAPKVKT
jgi:hypothetical protein